MVEGLGAREPLEPLREGETPPQLVGWLVVSRGRWEPL